MTATPRAMTTREVEEASSEDREFVELRQFIRNGNWKGDQHKQYIPVCSELCVIGKLILQGTRIFIPKKLRPLVLSLARDCGQKYGGRELIEKPRDFARPVMVASL